MVLNVETEIHLIIGLVIKRRRRGFLSPHKNQQLLHKLMRVVGCSTITEQSVVYSLFLRCRLSVSKWDSTTMKFTRYRFINAVTQLRPSENKMAIWKACEKKVFFNQNVNKIVFYFGGWFAVAFGAAWVNRLFHPFGLYLNNDHFIYTEFSGGGDGVVGIVLPLSFVCAFF